MIDESQRIVPLSVAEILAGGGEMGALVRAHDWSATALGPVDGWPQSLRTAVSIMLNSKFPMVIWWGPELILLYNDAWRPILGTTKHPQALGSSGQLIWPEVWDVIGPMFETVMTSGQATWSDDKLLLVNRYGYTEEAYFTWSYSAVRDENGAVGGVFTAVTETTEPVISARRLKTLRDLAARSLEVRSVDVACRIAAETLAENPYDAPFALFYRREDNGKQLRLVATAGIEPGTEAGPPVVTLNNEAHEAQIFPLAQVARSGVTAYVEDRDAARWITLPVGVWGERPHSLLVLPVMVAGSASPELLVVFAVSPHKALDADYRNFFDLVTKQVAAAVADAQAYEREHRRVEELSALDRAKNTFFGNISHELRTPLTLMLGPLQELLAQDDSTLLGSVRDNLDGTYRNSLRLLKLVNTLLDFSRIEAGRIEARYAPTDLAGFTADLAGVFRAAIEHAGLTLTVDCPPLAEPAYVDQAMWEKIVLNLLSNAFKFTFAGEIKVSLRQVHERFELTVSDTGTGILPAELPHLFERFHRIAGARGRSIEGTGIGLALVQELVRLHGGTVQVASTIEQGSSFTVAIPRGYAHLPTEHLDSIPSRATTPIIGEAFVAEALQWLPNGSFNDQRPLIDAPLDHGHTVVDGRLAADNGQGQARILLADDNADMRQYLQRILAFKYQVVAVADGAAALVAAREHLPDLVLADVMMPGLDGFGLIKRLRADPYTKMIPIILLSARAGEEALVEGLEAGADDYMIKPFGARELLARVGSHVELAQVRRAAALHEQTLRAEAEAARAQLGAILSSISDAFVTVDHDWRYTYINDQAEVLLRRPSGELVGQQIWEVFPETVGSMAYTQLQRAMTERTSVSFEEAHPISGRWFESRAYPSEAGLSIFFSDISERKRTEAALQASEAQLRLITDGMPALVSYVDNERRYQFVNKTYTEWFGHAVEELRGKYVWEVLGQAAYEAAKPDVDRVLSGQHITFERFVPYKGLGTRFVQANYIPDLSEAGEVKGYYALILDLSERKRAEEDLRESEEKYRALTDLSLHMVWMLATDGSIIYLSEKWFDYTGIRQDEVHQSGWLNVLHPDERESISDELQRALARGDDYEMELRLRRKDGDYRWHLTRATPLRDDQGTILRWLGVTFDINERKQIEEALLESEARLQLALQATDMVAWEWDVRHNQITTTESFERIYGLPATRIAEEGFQLVHPDDLARHQGIVQRALTERSTYHSEFRITRLDTKRTVWLEEWGFTIADDTGAASKLIGVAMDISERKRAEAGLRFLADASAGLNAVLHLGTTLQQVVERAVPSFADLCILYLLESDGSPGQITVAHVEPSKADLVRRLLDHTPDPQAAIGLGRVVRSQATEFLPEVTATLLAEAEPSLDQAQLIQAIGAKSSITVPLRIHSQSIGAMQFVITESTYRFTEDDRTLAEEVTRRCALAIENARLYVAEQAARTRADAIAQQRAQLQSITAALATALTPAQVADVFIAQAVPVVGAVACWVVLLTEDKRMLEVIRTVGYPPQLVDFWRQIPLDTQAPVADAIRTGQAVWIESLDQRRARYPTAAATDTTDFGTWAALPLMVNGRTLGGIGLSFRDFGPVSVEDQGFILSATQQCAQAFERAQLYAAEQQARAAAEAAVHIRDQFLAVAAHELKTPLTALLGYSQTLLRRVVRDASLGERDQRLLRQTGDQTLRLNRLVDTLLDVGRIETGRLSIEHQPLDVSALLRRIISAMQPLLEQHSLELSGTDQPLTISGDELRLEQVFQNLLSNAVKYSPAGGAVRVALTHQGDSVRIAVRDEGIGIPQAAIPQLFQRFYRVAGTDTSHIAGMGIGLYVVKEIINLHGGSVLVESTEGVGSTFTIHLSRSSRPAVHDGPA